MGVLQALAMFLRAWLVLRVKKEVINAPQAPWQNAYCERAIGSIRRA